MKEEKEHPKKMGHFYKFWQSKNTDWRVAYEPNNTIEKIVVCKDSKTMDKYKSGIYHLCCPDCRKIICWTSCRSFQKKNIYIYSEHCKSNRLKDSVKIHLKEVDWEDGAWIYLAEDRECCWTVVNVVMNFNIQ